MSSRSARRSATRERRRAKGGMPPRGSNTARMQLCGFSKARPISCSVCPAFQRIQTSRFSLAESPKRIPDLMTAPPLQNRFTSDGVASTCRMHPTYRDLPFAFSYQAYLSDDVGVGAGRQQRRPQRKRRLPLQQAREHLNELDDIEAGIRSTHSDSLFRPQRHNRIDSRRPPRRNRARRQSHYRQNAHHACQHQGIERVHAVNLVCHGFL